MLPSAQSPADYLIAWENVLFNLLELVISSSVISLYFWLETLKNLNISVTFIAHVNIIKRQSSICRNEY